MGEAANGGAVTPPPEMLFGRGGAMLEVKRKIELVACADVPILIQGESGTGKDLCAQLIHESSHRAQGALVKVSCPAIPGALLETELFGFEKGAFTGANVVKQGRVEQAHQGTLVLDEVGSLEMYMQSKLLQVLQDGTFMRVGGHVPRKISTRLISIASRDLRGQVEEGTFRLDFLYRINAVTIDLPPLRERREDLPALIDYFGRQYAESFGVPIRALSKGLMRFLLRYEWPGNIRQLDNLIRSHTLLGDEELILGELSPAVVPNEAIAAKLDLSQPVSLTEITKRATQDLERQIIMKVFQACGWNRRKTAKWLNISYRALLYKLAEIESRESGAKPAGTRKSESAPVRSGLGVSLE